MEAHYFIEYHNLHYLLFRDVKACKNGVAAIYCKAEILILDSSSYYSSWGKHFFFKDVLNVISPDCGQVLLVRLFKDEVKSNAAWETVLVDFVLLNRQWSEGQIPSICILSQKWWIFEAMTSARFFHLTPKIAVENSTAHLTHLCSLIFTSTFYCL